MSQNVIQSLEFNKIKNILKTYAVTFMGVKKAEELTPSQNYNDVEYMQSETTEATNMYLRQRELPLIPISNIKDIVKKVDIGGILAIPELLKIADTLRVSRKLKDSFVENDFEENEFTIIPKYYTQLYTNKNVEDEISRCIKNEDELDDRASSELYNIRKKIRELELRIKDKLNEIIRSSSKYLQDTVVTFRNGRYVVPVKQEYKEKVPGLIHDSSSTGSTIFIEPNAVFNMNNEIKELQIAEELEVERILALLTQIISTITDALIATQNTIGDIDFAFTKAKYSIAINAFEPKLNENRYINLKSARHPLIPSNAVIPIDVWIGKEYNSLVITGPNTGGKTVTLKTIGLLTLMAESGLHIPAKEGSEICVFENVYTDIGDEQSIEQSLSTFSSHMSNVVSILTKATNKDLILLDELGSGTDPIEGAAIAMAILEHLHDASCTTVATTHYSELKLFAIQKKGIENASCEFDVETLRPTYKLLVGIPGKSNAFAISKKLGLADEILEKANTYLTSEDIRFEDVINDMEQNKKLALEEREKSQKILQEAKKEKEIIEAEKEKLDKEKNAILSKAKIEARDILLDVNEQANEIISELTNIKNSTDKNIGKLAEEERLKLKKSIAELQKDLIIPTEKIENSIKEKDIKKGMQIYIPSLEQIATVITLPDKKKNIEVQAGILKLTINISKVQKLQKENTNAPKATVNSKIKAKAADISSEIKLLGLTADEAISKLEKYIDDAVVAGLPIIRIVHGKGTGSLRKAVQDYLKNYPHVKAYRLGEYGEGDSGVTIAELK